jgi:hypothetical protein
MTIHKVGAIGDATFRTVTISVNQLSNNLYDPPDIKSYSFNKREACLKYKSTLQSLDQYLLDVRKELFTRMKNDSNLRKSLLSYYEQNKDNLPFRIIN